MAGDYTRFRYNTLKDTNGVLMQQGRVLLDQDWNEYVQLQNRRWRSETMDIIGRAVVPIDTPHGFEILIAVGGRSFTIGVGRMYIDGLQAENHGIDPTQPTERIYNETLGEFVGTSPIPYENQPYLPIPAALPTDNQPHLVYLDVWEREVTYLEDPAARSPLDSPGPGLIDQAVAVDTGTRLQTVWQVKVLADPTVDCSTLPINVPTLAPSAGRLTTAAAGVPASTDPCIVPANGGYRGSGNRCYRVEIHNGGPMGTATFKWSRDNASVATAVTGINAALDTLTVVLTKRDSVLRFQTGDWVEVIDDVRYFSGLPGELRQVAIVDDVNLTIQLKTALPVGEFDATKPERHTRVVRWDQKGIVRDPLGNQIIDVDANGGLIPVPAAGTTIVLEDGIQITFSIDGAMLVRNFLAFDYWMFDARVVDASIEILTQAAPRGILHHYAWLAMVTLPNGLVHNCRSFWPPQVGGSCDCTVCVTADSHNSGTLTLQSAVKQVAEAGGKICLSPGNYLITAPVMITNANNIEISGHGEPTLVASNLNDGSPIFQIDRCMNIDVEGISLLGPPAGPNQQPVNGVAISSSLFIRIHRCVFTGFVSAPPGAASTPSTMSLGVGLSNFVSNLQVEDCFFNTVAVGIGVLPTEADTRPCLAFSFIRDNVLSCTDAGLMFGSLFGYLVGYATVDHHVLPALFLDVSFTGNVVGSQVGFLFGGNGLDIAVEGNFFTLNANADSKAANAAIVCSGSQVSINNNQIDGDLTTPGRDGIVLGSRIMLGLEVTGNRITHLTGNGILVAPWTVLLDASISNNQLLVLGGAGIQSQPGSFAINLDVVANSISLVGVSTDAGPIFAGICLFSNAILAANIDNNAIEAVGLDPQLASPRFGIFLLIGIDARISGNRISDIGPQSTVRFAGGGISPLYVSGRLDVLGNEVRRASNPQMKGDPSNWFAIWSSFVVGTVNVRGNVLESFGSAPTALLSGYSGSCIFTENQCFLDNPASAPLPNIAVELRGFEQAGIAIIASNNFVQTHVTLNREKLTPVAMTLKPGGANKALTVLGNVTTGEILVNGTPLGMPWAPLNVNII